MSVEQIKADLRHACQRGVKEIYLLDPTLNQRPDFAGFLRLLAQGDPGRQFTYSAELGAEGIRAETARLLREANFQEVDGPAIGGSGGPEADGTARQPGGLRSRRPGDAR